MPSLPRIPQNRVIDAVPVALAMILISVAWILPAAAALSMLHIWLWMRHPRSKSRYLIFAAAMSLYLGVFVATPLLLDYAERLTYGHSIMRTPKVPMYLMIAAATGILPILYRVMSRYSLTFHGESPSTDDHADSRAGISDLLLLSLLCSIVFITARIPQDAVGWGWAPTLDLLVSLVISAFALLGMRLGAHGSRAFGFAAFIFVWIGGYAAIKLMFWGVDYVREHLLDKPEWLFDSSSRYWSAENQPFFVAMFFVALFPSLCRRCGVVLTNRSWAELKSSDVPEAGVGNETVAKAGKWSRLGDIFGWLMLLACLCMITLYPFTSVEEYSSQNGYRVAGWPIEYWQQVQNEDSSDPWYWTSGGLWNTIDFHLVPLVFDVLLTLVFWMLILPPRRFKTRIGPRWLRIARWTCVAGVLLQLTVTNYIGPFYRNRTFSACTGLGIRHREGAPTIGLFPSISQVIEEKMLPKEFQVERGLPTDVTFENSPSDALTEGLAISTLHSVVLHHCTLEPQHIDMLISLPHLWHLELVECQYPLGALNDLLNAPSLTLMEIVEINGDRLVLTDQNYQGYRVGSTKSNPPNYRMNWQCAGRDLALPERVTELILTVPNSGDPQYVLSNAPDLNRMELKNSTGEVPDSVAKLWIRNAPSLVDLSLDNCQRVDLTIDSTSPVEAIHGLIGSADDTHARLTSLQMNGGSNLTFVSVDVSDCNQWDLGQFAEDAFLTHLTLTGKSLGQFEGRSRLAVAPTASLLRQLPEGLEVLNLELQYVEFDRNVVRAMPKISYGLSLIDCVIAGDSFSDVGNALHGIGWFNVPNFAPDRLQLKQILSHFDALWKIHIDGRNLKMLPIEFGAEVQSIRIDNLNVDPKSLVNYDWGDIFELELVNSNLTDQVVATWNTMPELSLIDLTGSQTTINVVKSIVNRCPNIDVIDLSTAKDPQREPYQYGKTLRLNGRKITTKDLAVIRPLRFDFVDLRGCQITPDALEVIQADTSDTGYELDQYGR